MISIRYKETAISSILYKGEKTSQRLTLLRGIVYTVRLHYNLNVCLWVYLLWVFKYSIQLPSDFVKNFLALDSFGFFDIPLSLGLLWVFALFFASWKRTDRGIPDNCNIDLQFPLGYHQPKPCRQFWKRLLNQCKQNNSECIQLLTLLSLPSQIPLLHTRRSDVSKIAIATLFQQ